MHRDTISLFHVLSFFFFKILPSIEGYHSIRGRDDSPGSCYPVAPFLIRRGILTQSCTFRATAVSPALSCRSCRRRQPQQRSQASPVRCMGRVGCIIDRSSVPLSLYFVN